jgi:hypothetical protein
MNFIKINWNYIYLDKDNRFGANKDVSYKKIVKKTLNKFNVGDKVVFKTKIIIDFESLKKEKCVVVGIVKKIVNNIFVVDLENI